MNQEQKKGLSALEIVGAVAIVTVVAGLVILPHVAAAGAGGAMLGAGARLVAGAFTGRDGGGGG